MTANKANNERRRYFRIDDDILLSFRVVDADQVPDPQSAQEPPLDAFTLSSQLDVLTMETRSLLRRIERQNQDLGEFLLVLERKIDLVARALQVSAADIGVRTTCRVNLSASGLAFVTDVELKVGDVLELKLMLPPALVGMLAYGRVISIRDSQGDEGPAFLVGVDFIDLSDKNRDLLIRHVLKKQSQRLREQRQDAD